MFFSHKALAVLAAAVSVRAIPVLDARQDPHAGPPDLTKFSKVGFVNPTPRGWVNDTDQVAPCGGLPVSNRTDWPLTGGQISLLLAGQAYSVKFSFSTLENPTSDGDFKPLMPSFTGGDQVGHTCFPSPDFSSLGITVGQTVTVQVEYQGDGKDLTPYYQCADVRVVAADQYKPAKFTCVNALEPLADFLGGGVTGNSTSSNAPKATVTVTVVEHLKLSNAGAGAIGAGVTLGVVALFLAILSTAGLVAFGRKKTTGHAVAPATRGDDESSKASVTERKH